MLHCLDAGNGDVVWKKDINEEFGVIQNFFGIASTPTVYEDLILVMVGGSPEESKEVAPGKLNKVKPNGSGIVAFDKLTGEVRYQAVDDLASYSSMHVADHQWKTDFTGLDANFAVWVRTENRQRKILVLLAIKEA